MSKLTFEQYLKQASQTLGSYGLRRAVAVWALALHTHKQKSKSVYGKSKYERSCDFIVGVLTEFFSAHVNMTSPLYNNTARDAKRTAIWMDRLNKLSYPQQRRLVQATLRDALHLNMVVETANGWATLAGFDYDGKTMVTPGAFTPSKMTTEQGTC